MNDGCDTFIMNLRLALPELALSSTRAHQAQPPTNAALTLALLQASHAECEPGTTADLLFVVLNCGARAWGDFSYTDVRHPCKIWWGAEDDKISEKSMRWMEENMQAELKVVQGKGHNLMACMRVMYEVFESLAKEDK